MSEVRIEALLVLIAYLGAFDIPALAIHLDLIWLLTVGLLVRLLNVIIVWGQHRRGTSIRQLLLFFLDIILTLTFTMLLVVMSCCRLLALVIVSVTRLFLEWVEVPLIGGGTTTGALHVLFVGVVRHLLVVLITVLLLLLVVLVSMRVLGTTVGLLLLLLLEFTALSLRWVQPVSSLDHEYLIRLLQISRQWECVCMCAERSAEFKYYYYKKLQIKLIAHFKFNPLGRLIWTLIGESKGIWGVWDCFKNGLKINFKVP